MMRSLPPPAPRHRFVLRRLWSARVARRALLSTRPERRGSAILLVLAVLSILALLAITVSFTARLETSSADYYGVAVQNRMAALTGVAPVSTALMRRDPAQPEIVIEKGDAPASETGDVVPMPQRTRSGALEAYAASAMAHVQVRDANARVNINAADEALLAGFFAELARQTGRTVNAPALARAIVDIRLGPDGAPGVRGVDDDGEGRGALDAASTNANPAPPREIDALSADEATRRAEQRAALWTGVDDPAEYVADVRVPAWGDDVRFGSVGELLDHAAIRDAGLDQALLEQAEPYLTVFSVARDGWWVAGEATTRPLLDINRASAQDIFDALIDLYGADGPPATQLAQFAANLVDARDVDSIPTTLAAPGAEAVVGIERTPFITEVYADSLSPDEEGDDGQFVELYNPWNEALSVDGWTLVVDGQSVRLQGRIAPGGFLIVTDDADERTDNETPGTGSLYDVFGVTSDNTRRRVQEVLALEIAGDAQAWAVTLRDAAGNVVDRMASTVEQANAGGDAYSTQRENPLVRETLRRRATPFGLVSPSPAPEGATLARLANYPADGPFVAPSDALTVFAGYADATSARADRWAFPTLDAEGAQIDARVIDLFVVQGLEAPDEWAWIEPQATTRATTLARGETARQTAGQTAPASLGRAPLGIRHGRVNPNTADVLVLQSLPGLGRAGAARLLSARSGAGGNATDSALGAVALRTPSDLLANDALWAGVATSDADRLARFRLLEPCLAFNPQSFVMASQPRLDTAEDPTTAVANRLQALVATDRGGPETLVLMAERDVLAARRVDKRGRGTNALDTKTSDADKAATPGEKQ